MGMYQVSTASPTAAKNRRHLETQFVGIFGPKVMQLLSSLAVAKICRQLGSKCRISNGFDPSFSLPHQPIVIFGPKAEEQM